MNRLWIGLVCLGLLSTSCGRKIGAVFSRKEKLEVINPAFEYLSAKAKFKFQDNGKKIAANASFRIKKDSIIWISISGLGVEGARVLINTEEVQILNRLKKTYYHYSFDELSERLDFNLRFEMIQSILLGNLVEPYTNQKTIQDESFHSYEIQKGSYRFQNFIGIISHKLEKLNVFDSETAHAISVNYANFIAVKNQIFPNTIDAVIDYDQGKENTEINISYNKMEIHTAPLRFPYSVSSKYEKKK